MSWTRHDATRGARLALLPLLLGAALAAEGCGKKGNPMPPLRTIPQPTTDLAVAQRGAQLVLRFAYPATTTAGAKLTGLDAVEVYEMTRSVPATATALPDVDQREFIAAARPLATLRGAELQSAIEGGQVVVRLPLPAPTAVAAPTPTPSPSPSPAPTSAPTAAATAITTMRVYGVRTVAQEGEASAWSNLVRLVPRPAPIPPGGLVVEPGAHGVAVSWKSAGEGVTGFAVYRRPAASRSYGAPIATLAKEAREHLDATARFGERYIYAVTALASTEPRVESGFGEEREVSYEDRFPPAPPEDPVALPQEGGVQLVWKPSPDTDAVGYHVYRRDPGSEFRRVDTATVTDLKFVDSGLSGGLRFRYRVTAVDAAGNEGAPTAEVEARPR